MNENSSVTKMSNDNYHSQSHPMSIDVSIRVSNIHSKQYAPFLYFQILFLDKFISTVSKNNNCPSSNSLKIKNKMKATQLKRS